MTVEELNIVITATNRQFNEALDDIMSRLEGLEEQSQRTDRRDGIEGHGAGRGGISGKGEQSGRAVRRVGL